MLYIVIIATLDCDFVNLLRCLRTSKSTKMRQRTVEMFVAVSLLINYVEIIRHRPMSRAFLAFHISLGSSLFLFDFD